MMIRQGSATTPAFSIPNKLRGYEIEPLSFNPLIFLAPRAGLEFACGELIRRRRTLPTDYLICDISVNPFSSDSCFEEFFSFHGFASGWHFFGMDQEPWTLLFSGVPLFPKLCIIMFP